VPLLFSDPAAAIQHVPDVSQRWPRGAVRCQPWGSRGVSGFLGSHFTLRRHTQLERERSERAHDDRLGDETRAALAELTRTLASLSHSIMWAASRTLLNQHRAVEVVRLYETELHEGVATR
jgi:hypothetical protein